MPTSNTQISTGISRDILLTHWAQQKRSSSASEPDPKINRLQPYRPISWQIHLTRFFNEGGASSITEARNVLRVWQGAEQFYDLLRSGKNKPLLHDHGRNNSVPNLAALSGISFNNLDAVGFPSLLGYPVSYSPNDELVAIEPFLVALSSPTYRGRMPTMRSFGLRNLDCAKALLMSI